jgi:hypothetical protein
MAVVLAWVVGFLAAMLMFVAYWLAASALCPNVVARASAQYRRPVLLTFLGLLMVLPLVLLSIGLGKLNNPVTVMIGIGVIAGAAIIGFIGSAGLCLRIGSGLVSPTDESQPWRRVLRGGVVLVLTFLLPFFGWFALTIWTLVTGFAAAVLSFREPKSSAAVSHSEGPRAVATPPPIIAAGPAVS